MAGLLTAVAISLMERSQWPVLLELVAGVLIYCSLLFLTGALSTTMLKAVLAPGTQH
jgi:hypothetical protein